MADGSRFPPPNFQPQNPRIPVPFTGEISSLPAKLSFQPQNSFFPQSNPSTNSLMRGQVPQIFPGNPVHNMVYHNAHRFPQPPFQQNQNNLQQDKHPMVVNMPEVQLHPFSGGQFATNEPDTNASPNSHNFSGHGVQLQFYPRNSQTNMNNNIARPSSSLSSGGPQLSQNNSLRAVSNVAMPHEQSSFNTFTETFSGPFSGPIAGPPVPAPMQFPPSLPSVTPTVQFTVPGPVSQPLDILARRVQELTSQEWINNFLKQRGISRQDKQKADKSDLKLHTAKDLMADWLQLISELSLQKDKLAELASSQNECEWRQELDKAQIIKARIEQIQAFFSSPEEMKQLEEQVSNRKKKREWQKRRRKEEYLKNQESQERKKALHKKIDEWRSQIIAEAEAKRRAESMKHEAGGVLGEVKRKQTEATKAVELLKALRKLREARKQEAEVKGVYLKPSEEQNRRFDERVKWLEDIMVPRRELYEAEEKTLRVMLAEEEEEKEKERQEMERRNQESLGLSNPMDWFHSFYNQAENNLQSLLQIRRQWDAFLVPETCPGASRIPDGYVTPAEPSSELWATALIDKG